MAGTTANTQVNDEEHSFEEDSHPQTTAEETKHDGF
jgi:hypothetical protein